MGPGFGHTFSCDIFSDLNIRYTRHIMKEVLLPLSCETLRMNERLARMKRIPRFLGAVLMMLMTSSIVYAQPTFTMSDATPDPGDTLEIDVTVADFTKISSFQYVQSFDSLMLEYVDVINKSSNLGGLSHLGPEGATVENGNIVLTWNDPLGENVTLSDDERIYTVRFVAIGQECDSSYVSIISTQRRKIEVLDENFDNIGLEKVDGLVKIPGTDCDGMGGSDIVIRANQASGDNGTEVCLQIRVDNFTDVESMQFSMSWDPAIITYSRVTNFNLVNLSAGSFGSTMAGSLRCIWDEGSGGSETLANNTRIFDLCFNVVGTTGQMSDVDFVDTPLPIEFNTGSGTATFRTTSGRVTVTGGGMGGDEIELDLGDATGDCNDVICIPLTVKNFTDVEAMQFSINFSPELEFVEARNFMLNGFTAGSIFNPTPGVLRSVWDDPNAASQTVPDGTAIVELCFRAPDNDPPMFDIEFSDTPLRIEIQTGSGTADVVATGGKININCDMTPEVMVTLTSTFDEKCFGLCKGFAQVTATGGSGSYTYMWFKDGQMITGSGPSINDLCPGNYSVKVTDANDPTKMATLDNIIINGPDQLVASLQTVGVTAGCNGEAAYEVSGGTPPYFYRWSTNQTDSVATNLCKGDYNCTITDANNCVLITDTFTLTGPPLLIGTPNVTPTTCFGDCDGAIQINPTGGCGDYTFNWSPSNDPTSQDQMNLCAGMYSVTVTDTAGNQVMTTITVTQPDSIKIELDSIQNGATGSIFISVSGGTGPGSYTYSWTDEDMILVGQNRNLTNVEPGTYKVTVIDGNGCMRMKSYTISLSNLMLTATVSDYNGVNVSCNGFNDGTITVNVAGGSGNYTYSWDHDASATGPTQTGLFAGTYKITVMDMADMNTQVITVTLTEPDALNATVEAKDCADGPGDASASYEVIPQKAAHRTLYIPLV